MEMSKVSNGSVQSEQPIPFINTVNNLTVSKDTVCRTVVQRVPEHPCIYIFMKPQYCGFIIVLQDNSTSYVHHPCKALFALVWLLNPLDYSLPFLPSSRNLPLLTLYRGYVLFWLLSVCLLCWSAACTFCI